MTEGETIGLTAEKRGESQAARAGFSPAESPGEEAIPVTDTTEELLAVNAEASVTAWLTSRDNATLARGAIVAAKNQVRKHNDETKAVVQRLGQLVSDKNRKRFVLCKGKLVCIQYRKDAPAYVFIAEDNLSVTTP